VFGNLARITDYTILS